MKRFFATILISVSLLSVSVYGKRPKPESLDSDSLFLLGKQAYISEDFRQSIRYLDYYVLNYPATAEIVEAQYYLASSYFKLERFQEASVEFEFCYKQFPGSEFAEEAHIRTAESIFEISEPYYKEQVLTLNAKKKAESFVNKYPNSEFADDARRLLSRIADKLARKELESAKLYFKFKEYEAAV
ncbi:outer membrane protein assembly factor BamD, partial [candidate division WOR-3 bacterium]|nr:outer membrane protein assembly factor BamD [candidate division WOR-3 bacterium]